MDIESSHVPAVVVHETTLAQIHSSGKTFRLVPDGATYVPIAPSAGSPINTLALGGGRLPALCLNNNTVYAYPPSKKVLPLRATVKMYEVCGKAIRNYWAQRQPAEVERAVPGWQSCGNRKALLSCKFCPAFTHRDNKAVCNLTGRPLPFEVDGKGSYHPTGTIPNSCPLEKIQVFESFSSPERQGRLWKD